MLTNCNIKAFSAYTYTDSSYMEELKLFSGMQLSCDIEASCDQICEDPTPSWKLKLKLAF